MKTICLLFILLPVLFVAYPLHAQDIIRIPVTDFNPDSLNDPDFESPRWSIQDLPKRDNTNYELIQTAEMPHIRANSSNSASGLVYKVDIDPEEYPVIEWSWKVDGVLDKGDLTTKKGDDYPARIYITFDYDKSNLKFGDRIKYGFIKTFTRYDIPLRAINYVWANKAEPGTTASNAYTDWVHMIAVRSGEQQAGVWLTESRNILEDYRNVFGEDPPPINGVAIMTDSDNTKESATGYYGDIIFKKK